MQDVEKQTTATELIEQSTQALYGTDTIKKGNASSESLTRETMFQLAELDRFEKDTQLKSRLTTFVIWFTSLWSVAIILLLSWAGTPYLHYSDGVLIAMITNTLAIVLGLPGIVTKHFFPNKQRKRTKDNKDKENTKG